MLDDQSVINQRDPKNALGAAGREAAQARYDAVIEQPDHDGRAITTIVVSGMGGSALAALLIKSWLKPTTMPPLEVVRSYELPQYVNESTLVIVDSYSGNTEETIAACDEAIRRGAQVAVVASGGILIERATQNSMCYVQVPAGIQPRMAVIINLRALLKLMIHFGVVEQQWYDHIEEAAGWLDSSIVDWAPDVSTDKNLAKQIALFAAGKTAVFYGGELTAPLAYKWKISWNENAKNVAFWNQYSEANHNEFMGWASHPVDKPFFVVDLISSFEHPQILKRFEATDRLLSGKRPKALSLHLQGDTPLQQLLLSSILADYVSIYLAVLNGVDPTPVDLIEKLKTQL